MQQDVPCVLPTFRKDDSQCSADMPGLARVSAGAFTLMLSR